MRIMHRIKSFVMHCISNYMFSIFFLASGNSTFISYILIKTPASFMTFSSFTNVFDSVNCFPKK